MIHSIRIPYFPKELRYVSPLAVGAAGYLFYTSHLVWATLILLITLLIFTTYYVTEINLTKKTLRDYLSLMGLPLNVEAKSYNELKKIVITKGSYAQTLNSRIQSRQLDWTDFTATLVMDNGTLDLITRNDKELLVRGTRDFARFLKVGMEDLTVNPPRWIA